MSHAKSNHNIEVSMPYEILIKPLMGLASDWQVKAILAISLAIGMEIGKQVLGLYGELFATEPILILLLGTLMIADLIAGIARAVKRGDALTSIAFRRTSWKIIEYAFVIGPCIMIANGFRDAPLVGTVVGEMGTAALLWGCLTEMFSIMENVTGSPARAKEIFKRIQKLLKGEIDETE